MSKFNGTFELISTENPPEKAHYYVLAQAILGNTKLIASKREDAGRPKLKSEANFL